MDSINSVLQKKFTIQKNNDIATNDNINIANTVNNDINGKAKGKYALDKTKFIPNTEETALAEQISSYFEDLENYAFYLRVVNKLGVSGAFIFWKNTKEEVEEKRKDKKRAIRSPKKYFAWKFGKGLIG